MPRRRADLKSRTRGTSSGVLPGNPPAAGATTNVTQTLKARGKQLLAVGTALTTLNAIPAGNAVTLSQSAATPIEVTYGTLYVADSALVPAPVAAYTGAEGTGYTSWTEDGNARTLTPDNSTAQGNGTGALGDPTRTTAKPVLQLFTVPHQRFTSKFTLMFKADAKGGVSKVRVYVEGAVLDITTQSWHRYTDVNGLEKWFYGYICEIDPANYTSKLTDATRGIRVFARAYPTDGTFQTQLIGPGANAYARILFYPALQPHGFKIQVTPSAGANSRPNGAYPATEAIVRNIIDALDYAAGALSIGGVFCATPGIAPLIEVTENCVFNLSIFGVSDFRTPRGWCTVKAGAGVTSVSFAKPGPWDTSLSFGTPGFAWVPGYNGGIEFRGSALVFDFTYLGNFGVYPSTTDRYWFWGNGCTSTCAWNMMNELDDTGNARLGFNSGAGGVGLKYQTDCDLSYANATINNGSTGGICRNNIRRYISDDVYNGALAVWGDVVIGLDPSAHRTSRAAFSLSYSGGGGTATIATDSANGVDGNVLLKLGGVTQFTVAMTTVPRLSDLVTWINTHANWSATLLATPNSRVDDRATHWMTPSAAATNGAWTSPGFTTTPYTVNTWIDVHLDLYQTSNSAGNNVYFANVQVFAATLLQAIFVDSAISDFVFENVFVDQLAAVALNQIGGPAKHLIIRNFADPATSLKFANGASTWADQYSVFEGGVFKSLIWTDNPTATAYPIITSSHFIDGYANQGSQVASGVSTGGTYASLYPNAATNYDIVPAGALLSNLVTAPSAYDALGAKAVGTVPKGPKVTPLPDTTLTKAQALELAAITANDTVGAARGTVTLTWKNGAGETGAIDTLVITLDVAA